MRRSILPVVALAAVALAACSPAPESTPPPTSSTDDHGMTSYLDGLVDVRQFRGAVEVRRGGEVLVSAGFGDADVAKGTPVGPDTRFRIGSLTKQFTALAVLLLVEEGKLRVADRVCAYLAECPPAWSAITVEQLLLHTSGLWDDEDFTAEEVADIVAGLGDRPTPQQLLAVYAGRPLGFAPGSGWRYSNAGYLVLGVVVERLSGTTYGRFLHDRVLSPLGMSDTGYDPNVRPSPDDAVGYSDWTTPADVLPDAVSFSAGGMYSTARDLGRWNEFVLTGSPAVAEKDTIDELLAGRADTRDGARYGYGIESRTTAAGTTHSHGGRVPGFTSYSAIRPKDGLSVVVLTNVDTIEPGVVAKYLTTLAGT